MIKSTKHRCSSCWQGEIDSTEDDIPVVQRTVRDPDNGRIVIRGWLCADHEEMYLSDGYIID